MEVKNIVEYHRIPVWNDNAQRMGYFARYWLSHTHVARKLMQKLMVREN